MLNYHNSNFPGIVLSVLCKKSAPLCKEVFSFGYPPPSLGYCQNNLNDRHLEFMHFPLPPPHFFTPTPTKSDSF